MAPNDMSHAICLMPHAACVTRPFPVMSTKTASSRVHLQSKNRGTNAHFPISGANHNREVRVACQTPLASGLIRQVRPFFRSNLEYSRFDLKKGLTCRIRPEANGVWHATLTSRL